PFTSPNIEIDGQWYTTKQTVDTTCQLYTFKHESRYLKFQVAHAMHWSSTTTSGRVSLIGLGDWANQINVGKNFTNKVSDGTVYHTFTIDLGVPTYKMGYF